MLLCTSAFAGAQEWTVKWNADSYSLAGVNGYLPFWARTGHDGILPNTTAEVLAAGADVKYKAANGLFFEAGANLAGSLASKNEWQRNSVTGMVDRLYVSGGWKMLRLDVGMIPREKSLGDLSISGGDIMWSGNARNIPGINASSDWICFWKDGWFAFKGNLAHYQLIDDRYVDGAMIHNKELALKFNLGRKVDLIAGFGHWAHWGGNSPKYGEYPVSLNDYYRIFMGMSGGEDASLSDQVNVLGNHLGREYVRVNWRASDFTMTFQYDKPFEDGSGMKFRNFPDGIWTLKFAFNDRDALVTDVLYEFINTTWQTGPAHDRPATEEEMAQQDPNDHYYGKIVLGGCDNYFSNGEYRSGWTNYGRTIGLPLILPSAPAEDGICYGIVNNRVRGHHVGLRGVIAELPYTFKGTFTQNFGRYHQGNSSFFATTPWQLSLAFEMELGRAISSLPLNMSVGIYGDIGEVYPNTAGLSLRLSYKSSRRF